MKRRIITKRCGTVTVVRVDGDLRGREATELKKICGSITAPLCLDLANLQSINAIGIETVHVLEEQGVAVVGVRPSIQRLLDRMAH